MNGYIPLQRRTKTMKLTHCSSASTTIKKPNHLNLQINLPQQTNGTSIHLCFKQQGDRIVVPRKENMLNTCRSNSSYKKDHKFAIQSANVSRQRIEVEEEEGALKHLQFSKEQKNRLKNLHKRTKSNHVELHEVKEDQMSNFSNSLQNISQEIIEIPFAKKIITPSHRKEPSGLKLRNAGSLDNSKSSLQKRVGSPTLKLSFKKKSTEKVKNKQNFQFSVTSKPKTDNILSIPRGKTKQNPIISLSDFNLKAIKITEGGSIVYLATHKKTNCIVAIKSIKKRLIKSNIQSFIIQLKLGMMLNHPNVAKIYGFFCDSDNVYVIKEYLEEGCVGERRRKSGEGDIGCEVNQVLNAVLAVLPIIGCSWSLDIKHIAQTYSICKITSIRANSKETEESFSQKLKHCLHFLLQMDLKGDITKDFFQTNQSIHLNMLRNGSYLMCSFRQMLQSILILTQNQILMLWQAHFLRQYRFKALMQDQK